jgi:sigma-E factor negative regulatory protein RseA
MKEKLSAFIDAELSEHEERQVLQGLTTDAELRGTWERYHLIRAAMTGQLEALAPNGLVERVAARLADEPRRQTLRSWPLAGGFVAAASLAALSIVGVQNFVASPPPIVAAAPAKSTAAAPVAAAVANPTPTSTAKTVSPGERLNVYLVGHNEFMPTTGMSGMLPYARVVTYDSDK